VLLDGTLRGSGEKLITISKMVKAYYYLYYKLYRFAISISDDFLNVWKPLLTVLILKSLLLVEIMVWYSVITKNVIEFKNPGSIFIPVVIFLGIANYFIFLHNDKWKKFVPEFKTFDKKRKNLGGAIVALFIIAVIISVIISFIKLSQINWDQHK
jgi:hypothetical protein